MYSKFSRIVKYGLYGSVAVGGCLILTTEDPSSLAIVRLTRTAKTAVDIGRLYKKEIYNKEWDVESDEYLEVKSKTHTKGAKMLLELCQANRGVYIKVGQHIGALDYLLPNEYVTTMRILHKDAPLNPVKQLFKVIKEDLKKDPNEIFVCFEEKPLGSASLAQVHRAKLKDGTDVAVKVQHHFVLKNIALDLDWMEFIIKIMSKVFPDFEMQWLVDETKRNIHKELNFLEEGQNAEKVAKIFKDYKWLKIPKIYWEYCTKRVLVMEYVEGGLINDLKYIEKNGINPKEVCSKLGDLYAHMIFVEGFVHSDPHPGNILLYKGPNDKETSIYLLDHGLYANLTDKFRFHWSKLWLSILKRDMDELQVHSEALGIRKGLHILFACMVTGRPWVAIQKGIDKVEPSDVEKNLFQTELPKFMHYVTQCLEHMDRQALLVLKTNDLIKSIEYALGTQKVMCSFRVMTKCCRESLRNLEYKKTNNVWKKSLIELQYQWWMFIFHLHGLLLNFKNMLKL